MELRVYDGIEFMSADFPRPPTIAEGLLREGERIVMLGQRKAGKTIASMQMGMELSIGMPVFGEFYVPKQRRVLHIAQEQSDGQLAEWMRRIHRGLNEPLEKGWFKILRVPYLHINKSEDNRKKLAQIIGEFNPDLTTYDPLYRTHKGDLTDAASSEETTGALNVLNPEPQAVMVPHHEHRTKRDAAGFVIEEGEESFMGSFVWGAWVDTFLRVQMNKGRKEVMLSAPLEREPWFGLNRTMKLNDADKERLWFQVVENPDLTKVLDSLDNLIGLNMSEAAKELNMNQEIARRLFTNLATAGRITLEKARGNKVVITRAGE
jgi:hypothetical protein